MPDMEGLAGEADRLGEHLQQLFRQPGRRCRLVPAGLHDDELVAAEARGEFGVRQERGDARGGRLEQLVAGGMAVQVVDLLEAVEVDDHDRQLPVARLHGGDAVLQMVLERGAVGQAGQRVEMGEIEDALLGGAALAQVADGDRCGGRRPPTAYCGR